MQCKKEENSTNCGCRWPDCPRPGCFFPPEAETTYDCSIDYIVSQYHKNKANGNAETEPSEP